MCLLIHKPARLDLPPGLLESAAVYNPHGYGFMAFDGAGKVLVTRRKNTRLAELHDIYEQYRERECVIHLRYGTSGQVTVSNTHPIRVTEGIYLAHNGTINLSRRLEHQSDTWHLVNDYLRPVLSRRPELLHDSFFQESLLSWSGPHNKFVFMDAKKNKTVIVNREKGFEINGFEMDGLWLSNTRWFDASRYPWNVTQATKQFPLITTGFAI